jgi:D-alanyl-D-alanine carboxypeptidase
MMNDRVRIMGCSNTEFGNISGIDNVPHYSTARDMARIVLEASANETFAKIWSTERYTIPVTNMTEEERVINTENYLISDRILQQFKDPRVTGGLAAFHETSGAGLVCTTDYKGMELVCVILGATRTYMEDPSWMVKSYGNFNEMNDLVQHIYDNYKVNRIIYEGQALRQFSVAGGESQVVGQPTVDIEVNSVDAYTGDYIFKVFGSKGTLMSTNEKYQMKYIEDFSAYPERPVIFDTMRDEKGDPTACSEKLEFVEESGAIEGSVFSVAVRDFYQMIYNTLFEGKALIITPEMAAETVRIIEACHAENPLSVEFE